MHPLPLRAALADWDALAADASRRGASAVASALTAETRAVPDVEDAAGAGPSPARPRHNACSPRTRAFTGAARGPGCRCQLTTQPRARRFRRATRLNRAAGALFEAIASGSSDRRLPAVRPLAPARIRFYRVARSAAPTRRRGRRSPWTGSTSSTRTCFWRGARPAPRRAWACCSTPRSTRAAARPSPSTWASARRTARWRSTSAPWTCATSCSTRRVPGPRAACRLMRELHAATRKARKLTGAGAGRRAHCTRWTSARAARCATTCSWTGCRCARPVLTPLARLSTTPWLHGRDPCAVLPATQDVRTVLETDFGDAVCDVNYFHSLPGPAQERVYICGGGGGGGGAAAA